jgi:hypothetical protein
MLAEISTTLLGFIAVFLVLSKGDGRFEEADRHFIMGLVLSAVMIVILALTPQVLHLYDLAADVWPVALTVAVMFGSISAVYQARVQSKMTREEALKIHWGWHVGAWSLAAVSALFIVSGLAGFMKAEAAYVTAVSIMLVVGLWCFVGVVFRRFF